MAEFFVCGLQLLDYNLLRLVIKLYFCIVDLFVLVADTYQRGHVCGGGGGHANINTIAVLEVTVIKNVLIDDVSSLQEEGGRTLVLILLCYW